MPRSPGVPLETTQHVCAHCLCLHAHRAARALAREFDEAFRTLRLTNGQFSLMMALNRPEPPSMGVVAKLLAMDRTTLTAALKPLERRGLVEVSPAPHDRRVRIMALTRPGRSLLARAVPIWTEHHARVEAQLPPGAADAMRRSLDALARGPSAAPERTTATPRPTPAAAPPPAAPRTPQRRRPGPPAARRSRR